MSGGGRTVLVTGAAGFVGARLVRELSDRGWRVRALVRDPRRARPRLAGATAEILTGDLRDPAAVAAAVAGADAVVHLAAIAIERGADRYETVNRDATFALLAAARTAGVRRFVQMSQNGADSASPHRFLRSKGLAEDAVRASDLAWTVLRPSVIFGPGDEFVNVLARLVRLSPVVYPLPGGGRARFQPVAVGDVAAAVASCLDRPDTIGGTYALGGPEPLTLRTMIEQVLAALGARRELVSAPVGVLRPLIAVAQRLLPNPPVTTGLLALLAYDNVTPDNALATILGSAPQPFTAETLAYLRAITIGSAARSLFARR